MTRGWGYVCDCLPSDIIFAFTPSSTLQALFGHGENCCFGCYFWSMLCLVFLAGMTQSKVPSARLVAFGYCMLHGGHVLLRPPRYWAAWPPISVGGCWGVFPVGLRQSFFQGCSLFSNLTVLIPKRGAAKANSHLKRPFQRRVYRRWRDVTAPHMSCTTQPVRSGVAFDVEELWTSRESRGKGRKCRRKHAGRPGEYAGACPL